MPWGGRAEPEEIRIYVEFKAGWDVPLNGLTPPELQVVKETARETIDQAFQGYAVRAILGPTDANSLPNAQAAMTRGPNRAPQRM